MSTTVLAGGVVEAASWRDVVALLKLRIGALVVATALASALAAGGSDPVDLTVLALACLAAASGASALNHYLDRDLDARMARTAGRPLPSGRIRNPQLAAWLGLGLVAVSQAAAPLLGWGPALYLLAGAATYGVVYTAWLKRRTPYSIVLGGAAGSFAALAGWQTVASTWEPAPLLLAAVLFLWTPSHFWSLSIVLERDYRAAGVPALSAVAGRRRTAGAVYANTVALVAGSVLLGAHAGWPYLVVAVPAGAGFLWCADRLRRDPVDARAWLTFKLSGAYLLVLLVALAVSGLT
ncbi:MAG TPA: heme o synthase [Gaiellaceae bacterium]|nr:heme o synthase [Gaiellaceae bacterium]